ncbi:MAG: hypothetical protein ACREVG_09945, partial [Burkholderiales bacterium]
MHPHEALKQALYDHCLGSGDPGGSLESTGVLRGIWVDEYLALLEQASLTWGTDHAQPRGGRDPPPLYRGLGPQALPPGRATPPSDPKRRRLGWELGWEGQRKFPSKSGRFPVGDLSRSHVSRALSSAGGRGRRVIENPPLQFLECFIVDGDDP